MSPAHTMIMASTVLYLAVIVLLFCDTSYADTVFSSWDNITTNGSQSYRQDIQLGNNGTSFRTRVESSGSLVAVNSSSHSPLDFDPKGTLWSPHRTVRLTMQLDGELAIYRQCDGRRIWSSGWKYETNVPHSVEMQADGNLVIRQPDGAMLWSSDTSGPRFAGATLRLDDNGSMCIEKEGTCLWRSGSLALCQPELSPTFKDAQVILRPGQILTPGTTLFSKQKTCSMQIQSMGNLEIVRKCDEAVIFSVNYGSYHVHNLGSAYITSFSMDEMGNIAVIIAPDNATSYVSTISDLFPQARIADLRLRDDCVMCVFKDGMCLWTADALTSECPPSTLDKSLTSNQIAGSVVGGALLLLLAIGVPILICTCIKKRKSSRGGIFFQRGERICKRISLELLTTHTGSDVQLAAVCSQYVKLLEIAPEQLRLSDEILGKGEFGVVYKGLAHKLPSLSKSPTVVAAKTLTGSFTPRQSELFLEEFQTMLKCGRHTNIVNILGVVLQGRPFLILEYCEHGSLLSFLRDRRVCFYSQVDDEGNIPPFSKVEKEELWARHCKAHQIDPTSEINSDQILSTDDLIKFSHQISRGMEHLASRFIIHRDLAARNILVSGRQKVVKITDFGLARTGDNYVVSNAFVPLPVLWMPPDTILTYRFSQKSDVWAFGMVLWEIFSLGLVPFSGSDVVKFSATAFAEWLMEGHQMARPKHAPLPIYDLMKACWNVKPENRPTFTVLWKSIENIICQTGNGSAYLVLETLEEYMPIEELDHKILNYLRKQSIDSGEELQNDETVENHF